MCLDFQAYCVHLENKFLCSEPKLMTLHDPFSSFYLCSLIVNLRNTAKSL